MVPLLHLVSPDSVAEAKSLIPSLGELGEDEDNRLTDDNLQDLLDELKKLRKYT